jgi:hypothetical protein
MLVPKAAMDEDDGSKPGEDDIRTSRQVPPVQTVPQASGMQKSPDD